MARGWRVRYTLSISPVGAVVAALLTGCAGPDSNTQANGDHQPHPMLAAARSHDIRLFGELPGGPQSSYFTRSAMSLRQHSFTEEGFDADPDIDSTGRRLVFSSTRHNNRPDLYIKQVEGVAVTQLTADPSSDVQPVFSPDDSRVAFASDRSGNWDIWVIGVDGGQPLQITATPHDELHPTWSPDGTQLAYCRLSRSGGQWELWTSATHSGGGHRFIGYGLFPEWSPLGDAIAYQRARERGTRWFSIWTIRLVDGEPRYPTEIAFSAHQALILPSWTPDGRRIAFTASDFLPDSSGEASVTPERFDIWVMNVDGGERYRLTDGHGLNYAPVFGPDGRGYFTSNRGGQDNIWSQEIGDPTWRSNAGDVVTENLRGQDRVSKGLEVLPAGVRVVAENQRGLPPWKTVETANSPQRPSSD